MQDGETVAYVIGERRSSISPSFSCFDQCSQMRSRVYTKSHQKLRHNVNDFCWFQKGRKYCQCHEMRWRGNRYASTGERKSCSIFTKHTTLSRNALSNHRTCFGEQKKQKKMATNYQFIKHGRTGWRGSWTEPRDLDSLPRFHHFGSMYNSDSAWLDVQNWVVMSLITSQNSWCIQQSLEAMELHKINPS